MRVCFLIMNFKNQIKSMHCRLLSTTPTTNRHEACNLKREPAPPNFIPPWKHLPEHEIQNTTKIHQVLTDATSIRDACGSMDASADPGSATAACLQLATAQQMLLPTTCPDVSGCVPATLQAQGPLQVQQRPVEQLLPKTKKQNTASLAMYHEQS